MADFISAFSALLKLCFGAFSWKGLFTKGIAKPLRTQFKMTELDVILHQHLKKCWIRPACTLFIAMLHVVCSVPPASTEAERQVCAAVLVLLASGLLAPPCSAGSAKGLASFPDDDDDSPRVGLPMYWQLRLCSYLTS